MGRQWVVICLGNEPLVFGPFIDEAEAKEWLRSHVRNAESWDGPHFCNNGLEREEHHVLQFTED